MNENGAVYDAGHTSSSRTVKAPANTAPPATHRHEWSTALVMSLNGGTSSGPSSISRHGDGARALTTGGTWRTAVSPVDLMARPMNALRTGESHRASSRTIEYP